MDYRIICKLFISIVLTSACLVTKTKQDKKEGASDCVKLDRCPALEGIVIFGDEDNSREGQPGSEKYRETEDSLDSMFHCKEIEVAATGGESVAIRNSLMDDYAVLMRMAEGARLIVQEIERQGPEIQHDEQPMRISRLWYSVELDESKINRGWVTAVYTRCIRR